ncbi:MAG TPA: hypothetical protein VFL31_03490 [Nitrospiraceae bacterium]|nr:hypothetical protein [Nitrospiraceae bacterium]
MSTITRETGIQSLHDHVVSLVAQRWAKAVQIKITINTDAERSRWAESDRTYPDIVGWKLSAGKNTIDWFAEVETEESLSESDTHSRWREDAVLGVPFYLFVPKGQREKAQKLAVATGVTLNGIYEYFFVNNEFQLS